VSETASGEFGVCTPGNLKYLFYSSIFFADHQATKLRLSCYIKYRNLMLWIDSHCSQFVTTWVECQRGYSLSQYTLKLADWQQSCAVPDEYRRFSTDLTSSHLNSLWMHIQTGYIILMQIEEFLGIGNRVHNNAQGSSMEYDRALFEVFNVISAVLSTVTEHILQVECDGRFFALIKCILIVIGRLFECSQPRLDSQELFTLTGIFFSKNIATITYVLLLVLFIRNTELLFS